MQKILFFGELPPNTIHGASISNSLNLKMLKDKFLITTIEEHFNIKDHETINFKKVVTFLTDWFCFLKISITKKHEIFYGVIYLSTFGILKNIILSITFKLFNPKSKIIFHFHRSDFYLFMSRKINNFLFNFLNLFISRFIVLSKKEIVNFKNNSKIFVLQNTIQDEINLDELRKIKKEKKNTLQITYIGNFIFEKGIFELVNAIKKVNNNGLNVKLQMFGEFSSNTIKKSLLQLTNNDENIKIYPIITGFSKYNTIFNTDLMVLPSYNEGLPITLLESLYVGVPIIISNVGYISEVLGDEYPLYCKPKSSESILMAINKYIEINPDFLNRQNIQSYYLPYSHRNHKRRLFEIFNFT